MRVEASSLTKRFGGHFALYVPSLAIEPGETVGLVGNNGAGKTTILRLLLDLLHPDDGAVLLDGRPTYQDFSWKRRTAAYLDESFLLDFLTADEYFAFTGSIYGLSKRQITEALAPYRNFFTDQPLGRTTKYLRDLSLGNAKKAGLIAALFLQPDLLILDEPFANLDPGSQIRLKNMLRRMNEEHGTTMLISSHDLGHVTDVCSRIALLDDGSIVRDLRTSPATLNELELYFAEQAA